MPRLKMLSDKEEFNYIVKVIRSCTTGKHLSSARRMIYSYENWHNNSLFALAESANTKRLLDLAKYRELRIMVEKANQEIGCES